MGSLKLYLSGKPLRLSRVEFQHRLIAEPRVCLRGKASAQASDEGIGSFQWTRGVQALLWLALRTAACSRVEGERLPRLVGGAKSAAASLDYAISRDANWIVDLFGRQQKGKPLAKSIFHRDNPERKAGDEVAISLKESILAGSAIEVFVGKDRVDSALQLQQIAEYLERLFGGSKELIVKVESETEEAKPSKQNKLEGYIKELEANLYNGTSPLFLKLELEYCREISATLALHAPFKRDRYKQHLSEFAQDPNVCWVAGNKAVKKFASFSEGVMKGVAGRKSSLDITGSVAVSPILAGSLAIFRYLRAVRFPELELDYDYSSTVEIATGLQDHKTAPAFIVLSNASAARVMADKHLSHYLPVCLMPSFSHAVLSNASKTGTRPDKVLCSSALPASPNFVFRRLREKGALGNKLRSDHLETRKLTLALRSMDDSFIAVRSFPYHNANRVFDGIGGVLGDDQLFYEDSVLLASEELVPASLHPQIASEVFDAWWELAFNSELVSRVVNDVFGNLCFRKLLVRMIGLEAHCQSSNPGAISKHGEEHAHVASR